MGNDDLWASGRDAILNLINTYTNITTWQTVRTWKRDYGLPIRYYPNGVPYLIKDEFKRWALRYDKLRKKN